MRSDWIDLGASIGGAPALSHKTTKESCLFGTKGQLWEYSPDQYRAIVYMRNHEESLVRTIRHADLDAWLRRLGVPYYRSAQQKLAAKYV